MNAVPEKVDSGVVELAMVLERWPYREPFAISRGELLEQYICYATCRRNGRILHGEGELHESDLALSQSRLAKAQYMAKSLGENPSREQLRLALPANGARNALDAMLWDRDCKASGLRAWELAGLEGVNEQLSVPTMVTITLGEPDQMAAKARNLPLGWTALENTFIKVKLGGSGGVDRDLERLQAVADVLPHAKLIVDPNEGWTFANFKRFVEASRSLSLVLIEQPLPAGQEDLYPDVGSPVPIAADESCTTLGSLERLAGLVQVVNLKLDKCGGLTEALMMCSRAREIGLELMIGCNCGTSLAMAPAFLVATQCKYVDLDGPMYTKGDRAHPMQYNNFRLNAPSADLWG